jgi:hypothetical protein
LTRCGIFFTILCLALGIIFSGMPAAGAEQMTNSTIADPGNPDNADIIPAPESLPTLLFDNSQPKITISAPLGPSAPEEHDNAMRMQEKADTDRSASYQVPKGAIIYHSLDGVTTVFDANGNQVFSAEDADAGEVSTPRGDMPATRVRELPSGSTLYPSGNITWVMFDDQIILVDISEMRLPEGNPEGSVTADETRKSAMTTSSIELPVTDFDPDKVFLERVAIHYSPATRENHIDTSSVQWTVPASPKITRTSQIQYLEHLRMADEAYSYPDNKSQYGVSTLYSIVNFGVVSEYNRYPNTWDMSAWIQNFNSSRPTYYSRGILVNTGDVLTGKITGKYKINTTASWNNTESWSATISDQNGQASNLNLVAEKMDAVWSDDFMPVEYRFEVSGDFNVDSEANFIGDTTFSDFRFTDQTGSTLSAGDLPVYYVYVNN